MGGRHDRDPSIAPQRRPIPGDRAEAGGWAEAGAEAGAEGRGRGPGSVCVGLSVVEHPQLPHHEDALVGDIADAQVQGLALSVPALAIDPKEDGFL